MKRSILVLLASFSILPVAFPSATATLPNLDASLGSARATASGETLTVTTGTLTRTWSITSHGLRTSAISTTHGALSSIASPASGADWEAKGWIDSTTPAELVSLTACESNDSGFTNPHLEIVAEFNYPSAQTSLRYVIWAYPGSDGLRTQLWFRNLGASSSTSAAESPAFSLTTGKAAGDEITHAKELVLKVGPLDAAKKYSIAIATPADTAATQSITLTSLDNETKIPVAAPADASTPATAELGLELRPNGFVTIRLRAKGKDSPARLTSARLIESGHAVAEITPASPAATGEKTTKHNTHTKPSHRTEWLPVTAPSLRAVGYFNDTQNRHTDKTHLIREEVVNPGLTDWANILFLEPNPSPITHNPSPAAALAAVKESHKCVNQTGVDTGAFIADASGLSLTGFGLSRSDLRSDEWRWAWANWIIAYASPDVGSDARELAIKRFQRTRYPVRADLDLYCKANTWGSGSSGDESVSFAAEKEVLPEIDSVADLGLDSLQIDDGWQCGRMKPKPSADREWMVRLDWYPEGWKNVVARAKEKNVVLGIWHAARAPLDDLKRNYDLAHFRTWKLDFANLSNYDGVQSYLAKGRALIEHTGHKIRVNWDVTEIEPRYGYFWASECGNLWLANRKPVQPANVVPKPWLMLRETWEIARFLNSNKIEFPIQNFAMVNQKISDAHLHSTTYSTALGLSGIPVLFQTTRLLTPEQRAETKALLNVYKQHRAALFESYVFPIGDEPDNKSWSGFQWHNPATPQSGYLLIFRERLNEQPTRDIALRFLPPGTKLAVENLRTGETSRATLNASSHLTLAIPAPGDILFLKLTRE